MSKNNETNDEYIDLLGDDNLDDILDGEPIDEKISEKWAKILKLGLQKETKQSLLKKYPVPKNCPTLKAPTLNEEIKSLLGVGRKKDAYQAVA